MRRPFLGAEVQGYECLAEAMACDRRDRHVLAAAGRGDVEVLVTFNAGELPDTSMSCDDITVVRLGDFLFDQLDLYRRHG